MRLDALAHEARDAVCGFTRVPLQQHMRARKDFNLGLRLDGTHFLEAGNVDKLVIFGMQEKDRHADLRELMAHIAGKHSADARGEGVGGNSSPDPLQLRQQLLRRIVTGSPVASAPAASQSRRR